MTTAYATSRDGLDWEWHGTVLAPRPRTWDARGARLTAVLPNGRAAYDGRATKEENWFEQTGLAQLTGRGPGQLEQLGDAGRRRSLPRRPRAAEWWLSGLVRSSPGR